MDLPSPEWVRHVEQKWTELKTEGTEHISLLTDIQECLEDIRRSLEAGYPSHLQDKLRARQTACLNQLIKPEKSNQPITNHPTPPCQKSRNTKNCISPGRYILTTENKPAGEVVLKDEAFCFILIPGNKLNTMTNKAGKTFNTEDRHCHHCLSQSLSFVSRLNCSYIRYCGERCQKDAWERWHQWECPTGADLLAIGVLGHLALRMALKGSTLQEDHTTCSSYKSDVPVKLNLGDPMVVLYMRLQGGPPPDMWASCKDEGDSGTWQPEMSMPGATALRHMMQLRCNTQAVTAVMVKEESGMAVQSSSEIRIATAIFPVLSLLNHSCSPNTSISFTTGCQTDVLNQFGCSEGHIDHPKTSHSGVTVTVRASKDLIPGQEILHCYGPHCSRMEVKERQRLLLEQYYFHCNCQACQRDLTEGSQNATENAAPGLKCVKCEKPLQGKYLYMCSGPSCGHQSTNADEQNKLKGLQCLLDEVFHLIERDRFDEALKILTSDTFQANSILTETHPLQGELADVTACVYATTGQNNSLMCHTIRKKCM
uniref:Protein-lysine N-methyltransferase SMYD4 n=1 Tax=Sinocyclocheilus grahami TaxID=75366 RepID=A0A672K6K1_SINGR